MASRAAATLGASTRSSFSVSPAVGWGTTAKPSGVGGRWRLCCLEAALSARDGAKLYPALPDVLRRKCNYDGYHDD